jgi:hypothetical protein
MLSTNADQIRGADGKGSGVVLQVKARLPIRAKLKVNFLVETAVITPSLGLLLSSVV